MSNTRDPLSPVLEAYLELILELQQQFGAVRVTDLAEKMGRRLPSVTSALRRLAKLQLIHYESYRPVTLSPSGKKLVSTLSGRHRVLADFFQTFLQLDPNISESEACNLEHKISPKILRRLEELMNFTHSLPESTKLIQEHRINFGAFLKQKKKIKTDPV